MPDTTTANYSFTKPEIGASEDTWGDKLNQNWDNLDGYLADKFGPDNILGTVSQSAGVPTGALIERGSNANGEYVRLADGTQICTKVIAAGSVTANGDGGSGNPYRTNSIDGAWPAPFVGDPVANVMPLPPFDNFAVAQTLAVGHVRRVTAASYFGVLAARPAGQSSTSVSFDIMILATGRWY